MRRWLASLIVIVVSFLTIVLADQYLRTQELARNESQLQRELQLVASRLGNVLREAGVRLSHFAARLGTDPEFLDLQRFDELAARLIEGQDYLRRVVFVDVEGQVQHAYPPYTGPGAEVGAETVGRRLALPQALALERPLLLDGGQAPAWWVAVPRRGRLGGALWGRLDLERLLAAVSGNVDQRLVFQLLGEEDMLAGGRITRDDEFHSVTLQVGEGTWTLVAAWREGVPPPDRVLRSFLWLLGTLFMLSALTLVNRHFDHARGMALAVSGRIRALREETRRLGSELQRRLREEQALEQRQRELEQLLTHCPGGLFLTDGRGDFVHVSEGWCRLTGLSREQSLGRGWMKGLEGRDKEAVLARWYGAVRNGAPYHDEVRFRHPGGRLVRVMLQAEPLREEGVVKGYAGVAVGLGGRQGKAPQAPATGDWRAVLDRLPTPYFRVDEAGRLVQVSRSAESLLGYRQDELRGTPVARLCCSDRERRRLLHRLAKEGAVRAFELRLRHRHGEVVWVAVSARRLDGGVEGTVSDIGERKAAEAQMAKLSQALEQSADAAVITDPRGIVEYANPAFEKLSGYRREEIVGRNISLLKSGKHDRDFYARLWRTILDGEVFREVFINRRKDGSLYYEQKTITPIKDARGRITHFVSTGQDVTRRMARQQRLRFMAEHDILTELPHRGLFMEMLGKVLAKARLHQRQVAVMFLDMDCFKEINDTFGHDAGDQALKIYARRLQAAVREEDVVARIGGDEFAILVDDMTGTDAIARIARKIIDAVAPPIVIDGQEIMLTVSIGISVFPDDGEDAETLLKHADMAMYQAKDLGRNNFQFFSADMRARALERITMESSLRHALERDEFLLHYQPQLDLRDGRVCGVEALLRWQHPELGLLSPGDFVPLLEESGLIAPVGEWVLATAFAQGHAWHEAGFDDLHISVNLSSRQFNDPGFIDRVAAIIEDSGIDPSLLELELTESVIMRNSRATNMALEGLDRMGVKFSIDDFGTGYSSLSYLKRFPIDTLKIDRSFVRDVNESADDAAIVAAIIGMGHNMNLKVIAEGVEQPSQLDFLRRQGCDAIQGYLFSQPLLPGSMTRLLREKRGARQAIASDP